MDTVSKLRMSPMKLGRQSFPQSATRISWYVHSRSRLKFPFAVIQSAVNGFCERNEPQNGTSKVAQLIKELDGYFIDCVFTSSTLLSERRMRNKYRTMCTVYLFSVATKFSKNFLSILTRRKLIRLALHSSKCGHIRSTLRQMHLPSSRLKATKMPQVSRLCSNLVCSSNRRKICNGSPQAIFFQTVVAICIAVFATRVETQTINQYSLINGEAVITISGLKCDCCVEHTTSPSLLIGRVESNIPQISSAGTEQFTPTDKIALKYYTQPQNNIPDQELEILADIDNENCTATDSSTIISQNGTTPSNRRWSTVAEVNSLSVQGESLDHRSIPKEEICEIFCWYHNAE